MPSKKVLILYYSRSGNTKKMAKAIAEAMKSGAINVTVEDVEKFDISSPQIMTASFLVHLPIFPMLLGK